MAQILLIDDDRQLLRALRARIAAAGHDVHVAASGREGLARAELHKPNLIMLDVRMPGMDGYELCRKLKGNPLMESIPVVIMSANAARNTRRQAIDAGAVEFLPKPLDIKHVLWVLDSVLANQMNPGTERASHDTGT